MTTDRDMDLILDDWFIEGPERIADGVVDEALLTIERTPQTRGVLRLPRRLIVFGPVRLAVGAAAVVAVVAIGAGLLARNSQQIGSATASPIASPIATPTPSVAITASPSPTAAPSATALPAGNVFVFPGTYVPTFSPGLRLTIDEAVVQIGCSDVKPNCHGQVDVNLAAWLGIEFGPPQFDIQMVRVDKVNDPRNPGKLIVPPSDLATWIASRPGVSIVGGPTATSVGGLPATEIDITTDRDVSLGPITGVRDLGFGLGKGNSVRMFVLQVHGHPVVISQTGAHVDLQALVDSIVWQ